MKGILQPQQETFQQEIFLRLNLGSPTSKNFFKYNFTPTPQATKRVPSSTLLEYYT